VLTVVAVVSAFITIVAGILGIRRHFVPDRRAQILSPPSGSENGGRRLSVSGIVPSRRRKAIYWVAVQPSDCREDDFWWPQGEELSFEPDDSWTVTGVTLGREQRDGGEADIGIVYTIGLLEVPLSVRSLFRNDIRVCRPREAAILHAIDVRRVRW
jgi:hypothetical protein